MSRIILVAAAVLGCSLAAAPGVAAKDFSGQWPKVKVGNRLCYADHAHAGIGSAGTEKLAKKLAIDNWVQSILIEYAPRWSNWERAVGKSVTCSGGPDKYSCEAVARPCATK